MDMSQVWTAGTEIGLCRVWWPSDYSDIINWGSDPVEQEDFNEWYESAGVTRIVTEKAVYLPYGMEVDLPMSLSESQQYNYIVVTNPALVDGDIGRRYMYFIMSRDYASPAVTRLTLQVDVWTTWCQSVTFGDSFVTKSHLAIANANSNINVTALRRYHDVDDGLDVGNRLDIMHSAHFQMIPDSQGAHVIFTTSVDLTADPGTIDAPQQTTSTGQYIENIVTPQTVITCDLISFTALTAALAAYPWISRNISSVTVIGKDWISTAGEYKVNAKYPVGNATFRRVAQGLGRAIASQVQLNTGINKLLAGTRYDKLHRLRAWPYNTYEVCNFQGESVQYKPQYFWSDTPTLYGLCSICPPNYAISAGMTTYGTSRSDLTIPASSGHPAMSPEALDSNIAITRLPQIPILVDGALAAQADTAYARAYSMDSAAWQRDRTGQAIATGRAQFNEEQLRLQRGYEITKSANEDLRWVNAAAGGLSGLGSILTGNVAGGVSGIAGAGLGVVTSMRTQEMLTQQNAMNVGINQRKADRDFGQQDAFNAKDYEMALAGINAQVEATETNPPSIVGQAGAATLAYTKGFAGFLVRHRTMSLSALHRTGDHMLRWGQAIHEYVKFQKLACMSIFTYWQMGQCVITSASCGESEKNVIRSIFEKGVTVWNKVASSGVADLDANTIRGGVSY